MNTSAAAAKIAEFSQRLDQQARLTVEKMAVTGISLVVERLQSKGVAGAEYSKRRIRLNWLVGKELNSRGTQYIADQREAHQGGNWGEFRVEQGLQYDFVDLTYSGRMLGGWLVLSVDASGNGSFIARTGGADREVDDKLFYQLERYGDETFDTTADEQAEIDEIAQDDCEALLKLIFS